MPDFPQMSSESVTRGEPIDMNYKLRGEALA
jgi:hypothetical protein